jgi:hypothetical protein
MAGDGWKNNVRAREIAFIVNFHSQEREGFEVKTEKKMRNYEKSKNSSPLLS